MEKITDSLVDTSRSSTSAEINQDTYLIDPAKNTIENQSSVELKKVSSGLLARFIGLLVVLSFATGLILLTYDALTLWLPASSALHAPVSAAPLLLIGMASLSIQALLRPTLLNLLRALIVSLAFLLWGVDQLLATSWLATTLGDLVIVLYVIDLGWLLVETLRKNN